jgi:rare lipoprotein A
MGRQLAAVSLGAIARVGAVAAGCLVLAHCSGPFAGKEAKYSQRVVDDGEPVPKGGGRYSVGKPYNINGRTYVPTENPGYRIEGIASWYGPDFHGRLTANGEVYDMHGISAAHTTMPLPSYARVTNLDNGRSIIVRVNDRGPYARNRVIDLSIGTAKALDFYGHGLARVRVEYVGPAPIEGSDDRMLLATLRDGSPAPAPSKVMVASAKPFLADKPFLANSGGGTEPPMSSERPFVLSGASTRVAAQPSAAELTSVNRPQTRPTARSPSAVAESRADSSSPMVNAPAAGFAPTRSDSSSFGLMSGRGLY